MSANITDHADVLRRVYTDISEKLDAQSVARNMFQSNALTLKELQSIQSKHSKPAKAAELLLNIVMNQSANVYCCFLSALKMTDHEHVFHAIVSRSYRGTYDICIGYAICRLVVLVFGVESVLGRTT